MSPTNNTLADHEETKPFLFLRRGFELLTILLFFLLPFHAFLVTWLKFGLHVPGPLNIWKEIIIVILFGLTLLDWAARKIKRTSIIASEGIVTEARKSRTEAKKVQLEIGNWKLEILDLAILVFFAIGLLSSILQFLKLGDTSFISIFYGFKYDFLMLAVFLLFRHSPLSSPALRGKVLKAVLIAGTLIVAFAILQATILPRDFLAAFGYTPAFGTWDPNGPLATYQALSADHPLTVRAMGTFAGPNQFAMYCLILLGLLGAKFASLHSGSARRNFAGLWAMGYGLLAILGIVLSYSRSALAGLLVATLCIPVFFSSKISGWIKRWKVSLSIVVIIGSIGLLSTFYFLPSTFLSSVFVRENSTEGHWTRSIEGMKGVLERPLLGHGIGEAGPASVRSDPQGIGWIPENWYLQIGLEYGLIGLAAWLTILYLIAKKLYERTRLTAHSPLPTALLFSFLAISVACLFLHAWEDSAVAITWWGLAGLVLHLPQPVLMNGSNPEQVDSPR